MTLKEAVETYGLNMWLASSKNPAEKKIKVTQILADTEEEYIVMAESKFDEMIVVRMSHINPSNNFVLWGN